MDLLHVAVMHSWSVSGYMSKASVVKLKRCLIYICMNDVKLLRAVWLLNSDWGALLSTPFAPVCKILTQHHSLHVHVHVMATYNVEQCTVPYVSLD